MQRRDQKDRQHSSLEPNNKALTPCNIGFRYRTVDIDLI